MVNQIVVHYRDGRILKGTASNFSPTRDAFTVLTPDRARAEVRFAELKAVFFVKSLSGDPRYQERQQFESRQPGRRLVCEFADGERLIGWVVAYDPKRLGFFLVPDDPKSNNERIFVLNAAVRSVTTP